MIESKNEKVVTLNKFLKGDYIKHLSNYCPRLLDNRWTEHETEQLFKVSLMLLNPLMIMISLSFSKPSSHESVFRTQMLKAEDGDIFLLATDLMYKTDPELKAIAEVFENTVWLCLCCICVSNTVYHHFLEDMFGLIELVCAFVFAGLCV